MAGAETVLPVLAVEPGHIAEARRALLAQGRVIDDGAAARLLWAARALPAALDVLADVQSPVALAEAVFGGVTVELVDSELRVGDPLLMVARATEAGVQVEVVDLFPWLDSAEARVRCRITLAVSPTPANDGVRLVRFQLS